MTEIVILLLVGLTSAGAYLVGSRGLHLRDRQLRSALGHALEGLGAALVFLTVNLGIGLVAILAVRSLSGWFVSIYALNDVTIGILSLLQGLTFQWWRAQTPSARREPLR